MKEKGKRLLIEMGWVIIGILVIDAVIYGFLVRRFPWELIGRLIFTGGLFYLTIGKRNWARVILGIHSVLSTLGIFLVFTVSYNNVSRVISLILALFYGLVAYNLFFSDEINTFIKSEE